MKRIISIALILLFLISVLAWFGGRWVLSLSVADYSGEKTVPGLQSAVTVTFDGHGIPQVWAETDADMLFSLGWLHAAERLFQMELTRRYVRGELAEIFGEGALDLDKRQRLLRFKRSGRLATEVLHPDTLTLLQQYCDGINAWMAHKKVLPPEFILLGFSPEAWRVKDCLSIAFYQTWYAHALMDHDPDFQLLAKKLGEQALAFAASAQPWSPATVPVDVVKDIFNDKHFSMGMTRASNAWVISPERSASGAALHASDPHLEVRRTPGFWYITGLHSAEGTNILGVTTPGVPAVVMGHNGKIAFAFTVASVDVIDYYHMQRHPQDSLLVRTAAGFRPLTVSRETIRVAGESRSRQATLFYTDLGPVVEMSDTHVVALRWAGWDTHPTEMITNALRLHHTDRFDDFRRRVTGLGALDVNWVYSDIRGNIGYQLGAPIPVRKNINSFARLDGSDSSHYWQGYYSLSHTPFVYNPARGWIASCNNRVAPANWPFDIPGYYDPYRITRAETLLGGKASFSVEDVYAMQLDEISGVAMRWKPLLAEAALAAGDEVLNRDIHQWNGSMTVDNRPAALFRLWWHFLSQFIFEDEMGDDWTRGHRILDETLDNNWEAVIDDQRTPGTENRLDIAVRTLHYVLDTFEHPTYGDVSQLTVVHPLSRVKLLDYWLNLNRGPLPFPGDKGTLNANFNFWDPDQDRFATVAAASMRFVMDWSDVNGFTINGNLGQSGNPFSPHYDDFLQMNLRGERWNVPFTREAVFARAQHQLKLIPR